MPFVALLDANVLFSAPVRDTFLRAAERDLYQPIWSNKILDEMATSLMEKYPRADPAKVDRMVEQTRRSFPEALVEGYEPLTSAMTNHPGDRHVLAAAVRGSAQVIVTWNEAHFPVPACSPYSIEVQSPDEFACHIWSLSQYVMADVLREQAMALKNPPKTARELLRTLKTSLPSFVQMVISSGLI